MGAGASTHLTSGRLLARNTVWNVFGQVLPMAVGVVAIPPLVHALGVDRFGLLSLAWIVIGYFSLIDLGMGRALTKLVADKLGSNEQESIPPLVWTSLLLLLLLGVLGGVITVAISPWLVRAALKVPREIQGEALIAFELLAASIPMVTVTSGLRGILEAQQRFTVLNIIRIPTGAFSFAGPLLVLPFSHSLVPVTVVLILGRLISGLAHLIACFHYLPALRHNFIFERSVIRPLVSFGGWMTVSNVIGPIMTYLDRFLVGALLSVGAVAYYTAPFDLMIRMTYLPQALANVLFPAFATSLMQDSFRTRTLFTRGNKYVFLAMFPLILVAVTFAPEGLRLWLGADFAQKSELVLRILALGVFANSLAAVSFALIQGAGKPDVTAKLHLVELPFYLLAVWMLTLRMGITGTALAWTGRVILDAALLFFLAHRILPHRPGVLAKLLGAVTVATAVFFAATISHDIVFKIGCDLLVLLVFGLAAWFWGMAPNERSLLLHFRGRKLVRVEDPGTSQP